MKIKRVLREITGGRLGQPRKNVTFMNHKDDYFSQQYINKLDTQRIVEAAKSFKITKKETLSWMIIISYQIMMDYAIHQNVLDIKNEQQFGIKPLPNPPIERLRKLAHRRGIKTEINGKRIF